MSELSESVKVFSLSLQLRHILSSGLFTTSLTVWLLSLVV